MIQNDAFCQQHNDYMIEVVCVDYMTQECKYMCKKCYKLFNKSNTESKELEFTNRQKQFMQNYETEKENLNKNFQEKMKSLQKEFNQIIQQHLEKIKDSFSKSLKLIEDFVPQLLTQDKNKLRDMLKEQQKKMNEIRIKSINDKASYLHELKNKLIDKALNLENYIFSEHLLGQQLYQIPDLKTIFENFDSNNLLLLFEQHYHLKYQYITEEDIGERIKQYSSELETLKLSNNEMKLNIEAQYTKIQIELEKQKQSMLARFKKYQDWIIEKNKKIFDTSRLNNQNYTEIQMMKNEDFINLINNELANKKLNNQHDEMRETLSKICHLGHYDIGVSLNEIESKFMVKFIPKTILYNIDCMENNITSNYPQATQVIGNLNENGNFVGTAIIQENNQQTIVQLSNNERQIGSVLQQIQNKCLFNFDLLNFFPQSNNLFSYKFTSTENGEESYKDNQGQWELKKSQNDIVKKYIFIVYPKTQRTIEFRDIVINQQGKIDENNNVTVIYPDQNHKYEGQINNSFKYFGKGKLTQNGIIKDGMWRDGLLQGEGNIIENGKEIYFGFFKDGLKHGQGTELLISDFYYQGQFEKDEKHGQGNIVKKVGDQFLTIEENVKWKNGQSQNDVCNIY
ncbi:unnamed protein product [Paramecium pentaurelia]|uniref:MORN repeat protein n=1 Tax=Paramecium pentaurelia TaxID=43138 RepID=A0A8S1TAE2_9CILI|nr:unnamed protein product [Paramecium pentaurelia]